MVVVHETACRVHFTKYIRLSYRLHQCINSECFTVSKHAIHFHSTIHKPLKLSNSQPNRRTGGVLVRQVPGKMGTKKAPVTYCMGERSQRCDACDTLYTCDSRLDPVHSPTLTYCLPCILHHVPVFRCTIKKYLHRETHTRHSIFFIYSQGSQGLLSYFLLVS